MNQFIKQYWEVFIRSIDDTPVDIWINESTIDYFYRIVMLIYFAPFLFIKFFAIELLYGIL